ncbi:MAG: Rieske 2Fe-2S domain-containing protein [Candidatus Binataceae bacterium]
MQREMQELLVRTGPGTLMGTMMRRYWIPALLAEEIAQPDCPPVRISLLGERLLAFRDTDGRPGLIEEFCAHRGASLFFGRNEECGIRCSYHGWKYDIHGDCVDLPSQPGYAKEIKLTAYPCVERSGIVWAYMGPPGLRPPEPTLEWSTLPLPNRYITRRVQECNWLQALEGAIDSSHVSFLHHDDVDNDPMHLHARGNRYLKADPKAIFDVRNSPAGLTIYARRNGDEGSYYWRITQYIMPWYTFIPPFGPHALGAHAFVPIDDENTWTWNINYYVDKPLDEVQLNAMKQGNGIHAKTIPGTLRPAANRDNDYLIDRVAQKQRRSFSGVFGLAMQDAAMQESAGAIQDRTREHLVQTDRAIVMARKRLLDSAVGLRDDKAEPPGLKAEHQRLRAGSVLLEHEQSVQEWSRDALIARPEQPVFTV